MNEPEVDAREGTLGLVAGIGVLLWPVAITAVLVTGLLIPDLPYERASQALPLWAGAIAIALPPGAGLTLIALGATLWAIERWRSPRAPAATERLHDGVTITMREVPKSSALPPRD